MNIGSVDNFAEGNFRPGHEHGFTFIALVGLVAIMSVALATTGLLWRTAMKREKEQELIFAGDQFRNAIALYYRQSPKPSARYPMSLEDLLRDSRYPDTRRYLRRIYLDPISNSTEWGLIKGANGEIIGVHSLSGEEPLKKGGFSQADQEFEGKTRYSDWVFMGTAQGAVQQVAASQVLPSF